MIFNLRCLAADNLKITNSDAAFFGFRLCPLLGIPLLLLPSIRSFIGSPQSEQGTEAGRIGLPLKSDCIVAFVESPPPPPTPPPLRIVKPRSPMRQNLRNSKLFLWVTFRFPHRKSRSQHKVRLAKTRPVPQLTEAEGGGNRAHARSVRICARNARRREGNPRRCARARLGGGSGGGGG